MNPKVVLAIVSGHDGDRAVLNAALCVAKHFRSYIDVLHVSEDPHTLPYLGAGLAPSVTASLLAAVDAQIEVRRQSAKATFERWLDESTLAEVAQCPRSSQGVRGIRWIERKGSEQVISAHGCFADLVVVGQPSSGQETLTPPSLQTSFEAALFGAPRPVLIVPPDWQGPFFIQRPAFIAWNGSIEANRAIHSALALLACASNVLVAVFEEPAKEIPADTDSLQTYLNRHGIKAQTVTSRIDNESVGSQVLQAANTLGAGLLVMGGYTHSRMRESILGGVTKHVTMHARMPVLMAH